jgi:putative spermidine/putrescine transport system permease protein
MSGQGGANRLGQGIEAMQGSQASASLASAKPGARRTWSKPFWYLVLIVGAIYFALPLIGTFAFSMRSIPTFSAYTAIFSDPQFFSSLGYSFIVGIITIIVSIALMVPTAFWVRLRMPRARPFVEFVTLLPFVIPPIVLVFGLISTYSHPPLPFTYTDIGSSTLLVCGYVVLSFPYMYRAVDTGLRTMDIRSLTEASQSLGAGWARTLVTVILPNLRVALLSGAFLTLAIVIGEFTMANFLARPAFAPYLANLGSNAPYEQAAVALVSFGLTWIAMGFIAILGRGSRSRVTVTGAR